ncbi:unnamed protein product [Urochloa decumbens]|uniref:Mixed lineage kinase domain-containing protein n=1 Tax=Urochloa decumbens TaxID=240449 RepID=A0ABC9D8W9_9POAL
MEPVTSIVGTIFKLLQGIAKAAMTARHNRTRCRELVRRMEAVGNVLHDSKVGGRGDVAQARRIILCRLKESLDEALKLVESCSVRGSLVSRLHRILTSGAMAARFEDVEKRISTCLVDLIAASGASIESKIDQLAARDQPRAWLSELINLGGAWFPATPSHATGLWRRLSAPHPATPQGCSVARCGWHPSGSKKTAAAWPQPPLSHAGDPFCPYGHGYAGAYVVIEEDPTSCSVM